MRVARAVASVLGAVALAVPSSAAERSAETLGRRLYLERCAPCHGERGGGDGPAAAAIEPKPQNFRDAAFWKGRTTAQLRQAVRQGKPGTLMTPFEGVLSDEEIDAVVAYLAQFRPPAGAGAGDGEIPLTRGGEDAAGSADRRPSGVPAVPGVRP